MGSRFARPVAAALVLVLATVLGAANWDSGGAQTRVLGLRVTPPPIARFLAKQLAAEPRRGVVLAGLKRQASGRCAGAFLAQRAKRCLHGPDPAPAGVDVSKPSPVAQRAAARQGTNATTAEAGPGGSIVCDGDGVSGKRVQAIYARASDRQDRYATFVSAIRSWAGNVDTVFDTSAVKTGGSRHVRWVTDSGCSLNVANVVLSAGGDDSIDDTIAELESQGFDRADRMYLVWMDAGVYCGIATLWVDDSPAQSNDNNVGASYARVDNGCWGLWPSVEAHEVMHTLGAVQPSAPHSTGGHCTDEYDRMCYADGSGLPMQYVCPDTAGDTFFDCHDDDYFNTDPPAGSYLATHWNAARSAFLIAATAPAPPVAAGQYSALTPSRILDTRNGNGGFSSPVQGGTPIDVLVAGRGGVPASGVTAAVLNVTVTNPTQGSYLTVYPAGGARPLASNLNFSPGQTAPNLVVARIGSGGRVSIYLDVGRADVVADVAGWISDTTGAAAGRYRGLTPARVLDTRDGTGGFSQPVGPGQTIDVQLVGQGGVPSSGVSAVVLNATATRPTQDGYLTVWPTGSTRPLASNVNFRAGQTVPNRVFATIGNAGKVSVYNPSGEVDVVLDVAGWFTDGSGSGPAGATTALTPARVLDTRDGTGGINVQLLGGQVYDVQIAGAGGVPPSGATAVVLNATVTAPSVSGFATIFPSGSGVPLASDLNFVSAQTVPNLVVATLGSNGKLSLYLSDGAGDMVLDVVGYVV